MDIAHIVLNLTKGGLRRFEFEQPINDKLWKVTAYRIQDRIRIDLKEKNGSK